jgi:hypothetical protein
MPLIARMLPSFRRSAAASSGSPGLLDSRPVPARPRPAGGAGHGLGVEAAVAGVLVFRAAGGAHLERRHGGLRPVIGQPVEDRQPRAAMGAIGEGVAMAPVGRVADFAQAIGAGGGIGRDAGARAHAFGGGDEEARGRSAKHMRGGLDRVDPRQGRGLGGEVVEEGRVAPWAWISTPSGSLRTWPVTPWARASCQTKGRKPTPCTWPRTRMARSCATLKTGVRRLSPSDPARGAGPAARRPRAGRPVV